MRSPFDFREQAPVFGLDIEVSKNSDHDKDRQRYAEGQL